VRKKLMKAGLETGGEASPEADVMVKRWLDAGPRQQPDQQQGQNPVEPGEAAEFPAFHFTA
jgi:hypothetical protein